MSKASVSGLFSYPIKSFGGFALSISAVERRGLRHDRRWMLVDANGLFMTQRTDRRLALFRTAIDEDCIRVSNPSGEWRHVPLDPSGVARTVQVWKDRCDAVQVSDDLDAWFSACLDQPCSLVYMPDDSVRATNAEFTQPGDIVGFADAFPILVISEASLESLNSKLDKSLPMNRFRPNIVVSGWGPHEEDGFSELHVGGLVLRAAKQCGRCSVTATNQETGEVGVEPLRTLATYRQSGNNVQFGAYFVPESAGRIEVGQSIELSK